MYLLRKLTNLDFRENELLFDFYKGLPTSAYCSQKKGYCVKLHKKQAIRHRIIQPNHPNLIKWLVFDIDHKDALLAYYLEHTIRPQIIVLNRENGHAHYYYRLTTPVVMYGENVSHKPIEYVKSIWRGLNRELGGDPNFMQNLAKNPLHKDWDVYLTGAESSYTLDYLSEFVDFRKPKRERIETEGDYFGRNCGTFDYTRHQVYPIADKYGYSELLRKVIAIASDYNAKFDCPMLPNEVFHISKSITRFCKSPRFSVNSTQFLEKQRTQGRNGALVANSRGASSKGGKARSDKYEKQRQQANQLKLQGMNNTQIAQSLGVSRRSVVNWLAEI